MSPLVFETSHGAHPCHPVALLYVKQDHFRPRNTSVSKVKSQFQSHKLKTWRKCFVLSEGTPSSSNWLSHTSCLHLLSADLTEELSGCVMCCHLGPTNWWFNARGLRIPGISRWNHLTMESGSESSHLVISSNSLASPYFDLWFLSEVNIPGRNRD